MSSAADLSEQASDRDLEEDDADKTENQNDNDEDQEKNDDDDDNEEINQEVTGQKRVTFKDNQPDTIKQVQMEVNDISKGIDSFLMNLHKLPQNQYNDRNSQFRSQLQQSQQGPIYPNYSQLMQTEKAYQRDLLPQLQDNLNQYKQEHNKFFYSKQDMASGRQIQNNQEKYVSRNRDIPSQVINDKSYSQMNTSKYNYYGQYRHQSDRFGLPSQNNLRLSHSQQPQNINQSTYQQYQQQQQQQYSLSKRSTINDLNYQNTSQRNVEQQQKQQNGSSYNFSRNIEDINSQVGQLAKSIYQDTPTNRQNPSQYIPSYQNSLSKPPQNQQRNFEYDSINQRQDYSNYQSINIAKQKDELGEYSNKSSNQNSFNFSKNQTVRDLYKYRPKRVIDESELYGEIQQTFIPNKTSVLRSNY
ncbi:hypothetical protein TTHERM_000158389 (macronuclear) [Tetrahymena thermophila SB210]|uniref:Uncharacterized protein n=1 Tax=Tetrahymena thermophila (strain SB210) TaxID=312017 RepID=W7XGA8_TETTS|nr:hypothetical protein TTHERM_000158389 [Tetrahymena thermophila SB210]EWS75973.1 hypothetical protein TTHERM_000158389 [Tetrahymena thermophila SB210]|eukprot:XP_012651491.1 hypothetical protein TTHERM_000158389 [Tetrahymena thermophila SB210]